MSVFGLLNGFNEVIILAYVGQIHFQEHIRYIRNNNPQLAFALHILQNQHEYGHMNNIITPKLRYC